MIILPEPSHLHIEQTIHDERTQTLTVRIRSTQTTVVCPSCVLSATRVHSRYQRRLYDLLVSGYKVTLLVEVRRFFCSNEVCPHTTFAEPFSVLTRRFAQCANRLQTALRHL